VAKDGKKTLTDQVGRNSTPIRPHNKHALACICEINEQCLQMFANTARHTHIHSRCGSQAERASFGIRFGSIGREVAGGRGGGFSPSGATRDPVARVEEFESPPVASISGVALA
jgi:hypothetical protein